MLFQENGEIIFNPTSREIIQEGDCLVIMGDDVQLANFVNLRQVNLNEPNFSNIDN